MLSTLRRNAVATPAFAHCVSHQLVFGDLSCTKLRRKVWHARAQLPLHHTHRLALEYTHSKTTTTTTFRGHFGSSFCVSCCSFACCASHNHNKCKKSRCGWSPANSARCVQVLRGPHPPAATWPKRAKPIWRVVGRGPHGVTEASEGASQCSGQDRCRHQDGRTPRACFQVGGL